MPSRHLQRHAQIDARPQRRGCLVRWFRTLGGVGGPFIGGLLIAAGLPIDAIFFVLAGLALIGVVLTLCGRTVATRVIAEAH